jgi:hypothetical protein
MSDAHLIGLNLLMVSAVSFMLALWGLKHRGPQLTAFVYGAALLPAAIYLLSGTP